MAEILDGGEGHFDLSGQVLPEVAGGVKPFDLSDLIVEGIVYGQLSYKEAEELMTLLGVSFDLDEAIEKAENRDYLNGFNSCR